MIALFSKNGVTWSDGQPVDLTRPRSDVAKIVIGTLDSDDTPEQGKANRAAIEFPADFAKNFENLTHLHLWHLPGLKTLPELPERLQCLDVRGCTAMTTLPELPETLDTLVLEDCPRLTAPNRTAYPRLTDLSIKGCATIAEDWLHAALRGAPRLRTLDASACTQVTEVREWPKELVDARLEGCSSLRVLAEWPRHLRRVNLRGTAVASVPSFGPSKKYPDLDYVDLAETRDLRALPAERGTPRTLFLHGSGILVPPASEHGATASENVADSVAAYFADVALTGAGDVKRCKLLILGNGRAGKTWLSLALLGRDPRSEAPTSTDGIQFWDFERDRAQADPFTVTLGGIAAPAGLHIWDFGGQEIYHNTHQLFMGKGAVFVVVWNPDQDGRQPDPASNGDFNDEWRPLRYWPDFIRLTCTHRPRVVIVCSHHAAKTPELESRWRQQVPRELERDTTCFYVDSGGATQREKGQLSGLRKWLEAEVDTVIDEQGHAVPSYWEIAQDLVNDWLSRLKDAAFAASHNQLDLAAFEASLDKAIEQAVRSDGEGRYEKLRASRESGDFLLTEDRIRRTLGFLTHSGWVYWDPSLFQGRVIVGQQWALDALYAVLDRKQDSPVYRALKKSRGRFTLSDLGRLVWNERNERRDRGFSTAEQELLLTFMERCGLCFKLRSKEDAWREEDVYVSFEHLPDVIKDGLAWFGTRRGRSSWCCTVRAQEASAGKSSSRWKVRERPSA